MKIQISEIMAWANRDQTKWKKLIGSTFIRRGDSLNSPSGTLRLRSVENSYMDFSQGTDITSYTVRNLRDFFSYVELDNNTIPDELRVIEWSINKKLPPHEVLKLTKIDADRARSILKAYNDRDIVKRTDLRWLEENSMSQLLEKYIKRTLFKDVDQQIFSDPDKHAKVNYSNWWAIGSFQPYEAVTGIPESERSLESRQTLDFKNGHRDRIKEYSEKFDKVIGNNLVVCCAPSSGKDKWGPGLVGAVENLCRGSRQAEPELLRRKFTVKKKSKGGDRSIDVTLNSIVVQNPKLIKDKPVVVIDDITTGGNTLRGCCQLLWNAGANCVGAIAVGKTKDKQY